MNNKESEAPVVQPQPETTSEQKGLIRVGLVGNYADTDETRFLLTPEACGLLSSAGYKVEMESGASIDISFSDEDYAEFGVRIVDRDTALQTNIVLSYSPLRVEDIHKMHPGCALLCMMGSSLFEKNVIEMLLERRITLICLDNMNSINDQPIFADIIDEIDGRAAIQYAQEALSYLGEGKGVLLAGVAGINPCEVLLIGAGRNIYAAANTALNAGASVTLMNNDVSALMEAHDVCGQGLSTIAIHPRVLYNKVKSADVLIMGTTTRPFEFPKNLGVALKKSAYVLNLEESHPSVSVPRTVAMALSNCLVNFFDDMILKDGLHSMIATSPGVQAGMVTYKGKLIDKLIGSYLSLPCVDINVMLASN